MPYTTKKITLGPNDTDRRLDRILRAFLSEVPLSGIYRMFRDGNVRVSGKKVDGSYRTKAGDSVEIRLPALDRAHAENFRNQGTSNKTDRDAARIFSGMIIVETANLALINKPRGMLTHGQGGVDEAAAAYYRERAASSLAFVPAPLHRLDRNTSGALAVSASLAGAVAFSAALREGHISKTYLALLDGELCDEETWVDELSRDSEAGITTIEKVGKHAEAYVRPLLYRGGYTLAAIQLGTGRTHQIRAQAASRGYALAGDTKYGGSSSRGGYLLHCASLGLPPGTSGPDQLVVVAALPAKASIILAELFGNGFSQCLPPELAATAIDDRR
ncbi:MAG: hypothetical protein A2Y38_15035 [Spirochaetes bacterium GWB1_59_5]|nr:MAG: hypothetical protein A2Y38_15035 [Spirochaetes bacterium GWB1_59_5]